MSVYHMEIIFNSLPSQFYPCEINGHTQRSPMPYMLRYEYLLDYLLHLYWFSLLQFIGMIGCYWLLININDLFKLNPLSI